MANPRQRRKTRSSSHKPVKQSRRAGKLLRKKAPIRGPKTLQDAWDKTKTIRQNYAALGLAHTLNPHDSGGNEQQVVASDGNAGANAERDTRGSHERSGHGGVRHGFGKIIRDETGAAVGFELPDDGEDLLDNAERLDNNAGSEWILKKRRGSGEGGEMVRALEDYSTKTSSLNKRYTSSGEMTYLHNLVARHGNNVEAMARDRRRNVLQLTAGQIRRGLSKAGLVQLT